MNKTGITILIIIIIAVLAFWGWSASRTNAQTGSLIVAFTDQTADINNVSEINMSVNKVEAHSQTKGWVALSDEAKMYDLIYLHSNGKAAFYSKTEVEAGNYDQIRVTLGGINMKFKNNTETNAALPSKTLVLSSNVTVSSKQTALVKFDFKADQSLHQTSNGQYVFAPVVSFEGRSNASVQINNDDSVTITNGDLSSAGNAGMDVNGEMKNDFMINADANLNIDANGSVNLLEGNASSSGNTNSKGTLNSTGGVIKINSGTQATTSGNVKSY